MSSGSYANVSAARQRYPAGVRRLVLSRQAMTALSAHLLAAYPEEGCGILVGEDRGGERRVIEAVGVENAAASDRAHRYDIRPERFLEEERRARTAGREILGFFHSHPGSPAEPSLFDHERAWPYYTYLIAQVAADRVVELLCWRLSAAAFEPEEWSVED